MNKQYILLDISKHLSLNNIYYAHCFPKYFSYYYSNLRRLNTYFFILDKHK